MRGNCRHVCLCLREPHAGLHAPQHAVGVSAASSKSFDGHFQWGPDVDRLGIVEGARHHANDCVFFEVQVNGFPDGLCASAKMPLPESIAQDGNVMRAALVFSFGESAAHCWPHSEQEKEVRLRAYDRYGFGLAGAAGVEILRRCEKCGGLKSAVL